LIAAGTAPFLLLGLFAGVLVDRVPRRPLLIATDAGRSLLLLLVPALALADALRIDALYLIAFASGTLTLLFEVAYGSYLPSLIPRQDLVEGNSRLAVSMSAAEITGPGLAGWLVQLFTAPLAVALDALSFAASGLLIWRIRTPELTARLHEAGPGGSWTAGVASVWRDVAAGIQLVFGHRLLRPLALWSGAWNLAWNMLLAVFILYTTRELGLAPGDIGLVVAGAGLGALVGAVCNTRATNALGLGAVFGGAPLVAALGALGLPLVRGSGWGVVLILAAGQFLFGLGETMYRINMLSLRQTVTPDRLLGRMDATMRLFFRGAAPLGALLGGAAGELLGLRWAVAIAVGGLFLTVGGIFASPLRDLREHPGSPTGSGPVTSATEGITA
jgi:hypothetical protein